MGTKIEYANAVCNPVKGKCPVGCSYCYARRFYDRHLNATFADPSIRFEPGAFKSLDKLPNGDRVFMGSAIDLFHEKTIQYLPRIMEQVNLHPNLVFIFLTKCPHNLPHEWPDNCWVGVSVTDHNTIWTSLTILNFIKAKVKFISFEPLLGEIKTYPEIFQNYSPEKPVDYIARNLKESGINWVIIGAQTPVRKRTIPQISWIKEIVDAADRAGIPVFLKDNLHRLFEAEILKGDIMRHDGYLLPEWAGRITSDNRRVLRQELPREGR